ncbi:hypothetical protein [Thiomicrorhabdus sp.]|uniref:hypothetical protein n=1 Tax=Thiomicrorhabdus sp. TaxID=2039724 RepID=UPI002AA8F396|nr:hypothetical protein [Thiomicrorhabdus sp.]
MLKNLIEKIKFNRKYGNGPSVEQFINEWLKAPQEFFFGYFEQPLEWSTCYGLAPMEGLPDTHGYSKIPDIRCEYREYKYSLKIGYIEGISMYSGGTVRIKHFALNSELTQNNIGKKFLNSILEFFKSKNAVVVEFHENHSSKIEHYRKFFEKLGIEEIKDRVWRVELYKESEIPKEVLSYHEKLQRK